jgi:DNA-binding Lrp family transcriptional regulator
MDERDIHILKTIADLGDPSPKRIEAETGIPKSTVHYRLNKLREDGIIENDLYEIDIDQLGLSITVVTDVAAKYDESYHTEVGEKLASIEGVNQVYFTMGDTDFIVIAHLPSREDVERLIDDYESIDEIERTSSKFVITSIKSECNPLRDFALDSLVDIASDAPAQSDD